MDLDRVKDIHQRLLKIKDKPAQFPALLEVMSHNFKDLGFNSMHDYVHADVGKGGLGLDDSKLSKLLFFNPSYKHKAEKLANKLGLAEKAKGVEALNDSAGRPSNLDISKNVKINGGNQANYRIAKIKRDHPEVAERLEAGEFKSVSEAERAAGTRPPKREWGRIIAYKDDFSGSLISFLAYYDLTIDDLKDKI